MPNPILNDASLGGDVNTTTYNTTAITFSTGDIEFAAMVHAVGIAQNSALSATPAGWTQMRSISLLTASFNVRFHLFYRTTAPIAAERAFVFVTAGATLGIATTYSNCDIVHVPASAEIDNGTGTACNSPLYTPTYGDGMLFFCSVAVNNSGLSLGCIPPNDMTERRDGDSDATGETSGQHLGISWCDAAAQGVVQLQRTITLTRSSRNWGIMGDVGHLPPDKKRMIV